MARAIPKNVRPDVTCTMRIEREIALLERRRQIRRREQVARLEADVQQSFVRERQQASRCPEIADRRALEDGDHAKHALTRFQRIHLELAQRDGAAVARIRAHRVHGELHEDRQRDEPTMIITYSVARLGPRLRRRTRRPRRSAARVARTTAELAFGPVMISGISLERSNTDVAAA